MKNIIIGNGVNIQFGGSDYTNKKIIERALLKIKLNDYHQDVYNKEIGLWIEKLYQEFPYFIKGDYDNLTILKDEKEELIYFKKRYSTKTKITEIGFEDFFFLNDLYCRKNKITNTERFYLKEFLRRVFLDSIFNKGNINLIHENFPLEFKYYLDNIDCIFTTNYDRNIELATNSEVLYLHGAFHVLASEYDRNSFRNQLSDRSVNKSPVVKGYEHLFSTALTGSSGAFKQYINDSQEYANTSIEKFADGYENKPELKTQIETWINSDNELVRSLYEAIKIKVKVPDLKFSMDYALNKLSTIKGTMIFIGLSPNNDSHIISLIRNNTKIELIEYYYYDKCEGEIISKLFNNKKLKILDVKEFWKNKQN